MPVYYLLLIILISFIAISFIFRLLFSPVAWIVIGILWIITYIRRRAYRKQMEDYHREFQRKTQQKKEYYYQQHNNTNHNDNDDIIDVNYTIKDEE